MNTQHETNVEKLLVKLLSEVRDLRDDLARRAGEPTIEPKPWGSVTSVTRAFGKPVDVGASDVPSALTPEMKEAADEQAKTPGNPKSVATFKADEPEPIRLSEEQLANFRGARR
jgi:hypothetical protein